eukprot:2437443-Rhodomonas_salina.2
MSGTDGGYAATRQGHLFTHVIFDGDGIFLAKQSRRMVQPAIALRACYAMSGTDLAYAAIGRRACYALSGTD